MQLDAASRIFSSGPVELFSVRGAARAKVADGQLSIYSAPSKNYPVVSALCEVGEADGQSGHRWLLTMGSHTMRSATEACEPSFIFSSVEPSDPDVFFCVIFKRGHPSHELEVLEQVLGKLSTFHVSKAAKKNALPFGIALPQIDPTQMSHQINEIMRKGAEDTQMLLKSAGDAANQAFLAAAEMHKRYAPKPADKPVEVSPELRDKVCKTKQATAAGAAVTKGVATGMQAAAAEIGSSLVQTVSGGQDGGKDGVKKPLPEPLAAVGGIGMELLRDIAAVRDSMLQAAGSAWQGAREAVIEVNRYQYGDQVAQVTADSCDALEGVGSMGVAMKYVQPTQVVLTSAKETSSKLEGGAPGSDDAALARRQLEQERAALEQEKAALAAERARLAGQAPLQPAPQQKKGPFGLPAFGFT